MACHELTTSVEMASAAPSPTCHPRASSRRTECQTPSMMYTGWTLCRTLHVTILCECRILFGICVHGQAGVLYIQLSSDSYQFKKNKQLFSYFMFGYIWVDNYPNNNLTALFHAESSKFNRKSLIFDIFTVLTPFNFIFFSISVLPSSSGEFSHRRNPTKVTPTS